MLLTVSFEPEEGPSGGFFTIRTSHALDWVGWRRYHNGAHRAPAWPSSILAIRAPVGATLRWEGSAKRVRDDVLLRMNDARSWLATPVSLQPFNWPTPRTPKHHQLTGIQALKRMLGRAILADDMGLGKTSTVLWALADLKATRILVVCPVSVKFNWEAEVAATLGSDWLTFVIDGTSKRRADQIAEMRSAKADSVTIINYDLLIHMTAEQFATMCATFGSIVFDESHYLKNRKAKRTKLAVELSKNADHVVCCTGTPIRNLADDLFSQIELVRPGTWTSYRDFANRHLVIKPVTFGKRTVHKVLAAKDVDALNAVVNTMMISRKKGDTMDLPPKVYTYPQLELDGSILDLYKAMKEFARVEMSSLIGSAAEPMSVFDPRAKSAVEQAMRCEQIAQGFIGGIPDPVMAKLSANVLKAAVKIRGRPHELLFPNAPKIVWLLEAIESVRAQGGAPVVFTRFNAPGEWLADHLTTECATHAVFMHGGLDAEHKRDAVDAFQNKRIDCLIIQVKIAEGFNLVRGQDALFLGRDWSPAVNVQAEDRLHRIGQKGTVNIQIPIVRGTIEVMIDKRLSAKKADAAQALRTATIQELMEAL